MKGLIALLLFAAVNASPYNPFYYGYNPYNAWPGPWYNPYVPPAPQVPFSGTYSYHDGHRPTVVQANNDGYKFPLGAPPAAVSVPASGTFAFHDGHRPTVVQANNDGYKFPLGAPPAAVPVPASGTFAFHDGHRPTVVQANNGGPKLAALVAPPVPVAVPAIPAIPPPAPISGTFVFHDGHRPTVVQANNEGYKFPGATNNLYATWNHPWNPWSVVAAVSAGYRVPAVPVQKTVVQANLGSADPWKYGIYGFGFSNYVPAPPVVIG